MNFILKPACLESMLKLLIFYLLVNASVCEFDGLNKFKRKKTSMGNYVHPSILKSTASTAKTSVSLDNMGIESSLTNDSQDSSMVPNAFSVPRIVKRFVNILLRKAILKDDGGDIIQLESISDQNFERLSMSLRFFVNATELKTLREFGSNKQNLTFHQIDELLNNLFSNSLPPNHDCGDYSWDSWLFSLTDKVDELLVLEGAIFLCFVWILLRIIQGKSSWTLIVFAFISSAVVWEKSRLLEEEIIKSHSEQLRLGNIPEHCHGIDNRNWWEKLFKVKPEDRECYEHHYHRLSKPNLRVSYYKAFLNLFGPFLEMIISSIRMLFAADKDQYFFSNWIFQAIIIPTFFLSLVFIFTIYFGGSVRFPLLSFGGVSSSPPVGSRVQCLTTAENPKPPPRLKNGRKRKEIDEADSGSSSSTFVFNIKGGSLNLNMTEPLPIVKKKELLFTSKREECESQHSPSPKDQVSKRGETDLSSEESDVEADSEDLESNIEDKKGNIGAVEDDHLAGGDTNIVAEKVLQDQEKEM